jgi:chemotaxis signal transduction protein
MRAVQQYPEATRYLGFQIGACQLAIPQHDVRTIESVRDLHPDPADAGDHCGHVTSAGELWPVYALDEDLEPERSPPSQRRVCILVEHEGTCLGVLADRVAKLPDAGLQLTPLPGCMGKTAAPVAALLVKSDRVLILTTAERLGTCLSPARTMSIAPVGASER